MQLKQADLTSYCKAELFLNSDLHDENPNDEKSFYPDLEERLLEKREMVSADDNILSAARSTREPPQNMYISTTKYVIKLYYQCRQ